MLRNVFSLMFSFLQGKVMESAGWNVLVSAFSILVGFSYDKISCFLCFYE
jgi:hypothetical protein